MPHLRAARASDGPMIRQMIASEHLDFTSLNWRRFLIAEVDHQPVGIGQVKVYPGCYELGSLVVLPAYRGKGIASLLMAALESRAPRPLYLLCESYMESFYSRHGYRTVSYWQAPLALKFKLTPAQLALLFGIRVLVMRKL